MISRSRAFLAAGLIAVSAILFVAGCNDKKPSEPKEKLADFWPSVDKTSWTYSYAFKTRADSARIYFDVGDVPAAPAMNTIVALLNHQPFSNVDDTDANEYDLEFDGHKTTLSGAHGLNLKATTVDLPVKPETLSAGGDDVVLRHVLTVRPDLRGKFEARYGAAALARLGLDSSRGNVLLPSHELPEPILLHGGAWEVTDAYVGTYGDIDHNIAWKYLESNLKDGAEFSMQLVPTLSDDVFLHVRVLGRTTFESGSTMYENALTVFYYVDYGVTPVTDAGNPTPIGFARFLDYGTVFYVSALGPVGSYERNMVSVGSTLSEGVNERIIALTGHHVGGTP